MTVINLDMVMSSLNIVLKIRELLEYKSVPIAAFTAYEMVGEKKNFSAIALLIISPSLKRMS